MNTITRVNKMGIDFNINNISIFILPNTGLKQGEVEEFDENLVGENLEFFPLKHHHGLL